MAGAAGMAAHDLAIKDRNPAGKDFKEIPRKDYDKFCTPVKVPDKLCGGDYVALAIIFVLLPAMFVLYFVFVSLSIPPLSVLWIYKACLRRPTDALERTGLFWFVAVLFGVLWSPCLLLMVIWVALVRLLIFLVSFPVGLLHPSRTAASRAALAPHRGPPASMYVPAGTPPRTPADAVAREYRQWRLGDVVSAVVGAGDRQGFLEFIGTIPLMFVLTPVLKTLFTTAALWELKDVFLNQWSKPVDADCDGETTYEDSDEAQRAFEILIRRTLLKPMNLRYVDWWSFTGFYTVESAGREGKAVTGLQFNKYTSHGMRTALATVVVHTSGLEGFTPRSDTALAPLEAVYLTVDNPFHIATGYVEVNTSRGFGQAMEGQGTGLEHPMWLVVAPDSRLQNILYELMNGVFVRVLHQVAYVCEKQIEIQAKDATAGK